jgi:hypothetical protein
MNRPLRQKEIREQTSDGAFILPALPADDVTVTQALRAMFEAEGMQWTDGTDDDDDAEDFGA